MKLFKKLVNLYDKFIELYNITLVRMLHMGGVCAIGQVSTYQYYYGNPLYHLSGTLTGVVASILDSESTRPAIKLMNSKEFQEYGLDECFKEENPIIGSNPTLKQYEKKNLVILGIWGVISTIYPAAGYAYLSMTPIICRHNSNVTKELKKEIDFRKQLEDMVK